jgi:hypothetical protein
MNTILALFFGIVGTNVWIGIFSVGVIAQIFSPFFKRFSRDLWT